MAGLRKSVNPVPFKVHILGCGSALPIEARNPSAQIVQIGNEFMLVDCGEGTQLQLRQHKVKIQSINHIFISHLHGDHYFGLIGLLSTLSLLGRTKTVFLYAHPDIKNILEVQMKASATFLRFPLIYHTLNYKDAQVILSTDNFTVKSFPMVHRIPTCGFRFDETPRPPSIDKSLIEDAKVPLAAFPAFKQKQDYVDEMGKTFPWKIFTIPAPKPRSYAYCSDTMYSQYVIEQVMHVNLLYHEATFTSTHADRAKETFHCTAAQAAQIAKLAKVKKLVIGHFSARYKNEDLLVNEASAIFKKVEAAQDGATVNVLD